MNGLFLWYKSISILISPSPFKSVTSATCTLFTACFAVTHFLIKTQIMLISKEHLIGYYMWTAQPVNALFTGIPTRRIFDRRNGSQVLFLINALALESKNFSIEEGREIENLILNRLPSNTQSEISVYNWLKSQAQIN